MTLPFQTKWPERDMGELAGEPNYFIDKIWMGLTLYNIAEADARLENMTIEYPDLFCMKKIFHPKLHTIREDKHNRWKPGMKIHPVINNRTKNRFQFAPTLECTGVQEIEIEYWNGKVAMRNEIRINGMIATASVHDFPLAINEVQQLALNDGFPSIGAFFQYFNEDFKGKIIHWTELKY